MSYPRYNVSQDKLWAFLRVSAVKKALLFFPMNNHSHALCCHLEFCFFLNNKHALICFFGSTHTLSLPPPYPFCNVIPLRRTCFYSTLLLHSAPKESFVIRCQTEKKELLSCHGCACQHSVWVKSPLLCKCKWSTQCSACSTEKHDIGLLKNEGTARGRQRGWYRGHAERWGKQKLSWRETETDTKNIWHINIYNILSKNK